MTRFVPVLFRPLAAFPGARTPSSERLSISQFKVTAGRTLAELEEELARHNATDAYLALDVAESAVRQDGRLRADAKVYDPGVVLSFTHPTEGALQFANDAYALWHHNVRGILLTLESLRLIERWGAVRAAAQFRGFKALPVSTSLTMGRAAALEVLRTHSGRPVSDGASTETLREAYRVARNLTHPDRNGGRADAWHLVEAAARELRIGGGA